MERRSKWLLVVCLLCFFVVSQWMIFTVDRFPWFDVSFTLETVHKMRVEGTRSIDWQHFDVHAPGSYLLFYFWSFLNPGLSEYHWAQEMSVIFGIVFFTFVFLALSRFFGEKGELATLAMVFLSTYQHFFTETRMYSIVLALSAILFYALSRRFEGKWMWIACVVSFMLPFFHYMAVMVVPFVLFLMFFIDDLKRVRWEIVFIIGIVMLVGVLVSTFSYLIPQRERIQGMWLPQSDFSSWPSSLLFVFFMTDGASPSIIGTIIYVVFCIFLLLCGFWAFKKMSGVSTQEGKLMIAMGLSGLATLFGLVMSKVIQLYHHRFFLVVTWMFAASVLVWVFSERKRAWVSYILVGVLSFVLVWGLVKYAQDTPRELQRVAEHLPCDERLVVLHESPFSSLPFEVYKREHRCLWRNVVSTDLTVPMSRSAGFDIIPKEDIYWNLTIPDESFVYIRSFENLVPIDGRLFGEMYMDDGIGAILVGAR